MKKQTIDNKQQLSPQARARKNNGLDDAYVTAYCDNPIAGKTAALIKAGFAGNNIPQEAYRMHKRLRERIEQKISELIQDLGGASYQQLQTIINTDIKTVGYSNMLQAIRAGMDYAGRRPGDKLTIVKEQSIDDIDNEINRLQKQIAEEEGITIQ